MFPGHVRVTSLVQMGFFASKDLFRPLIGKVIFLPWEYNLPPIEGTLYSYHGNKIVIEWREAISHKSLLYIREYYIPYRNLILGPFQSHLPGMESVCFSGKKMFLVCDS